METVIAYPFVSHEIPALETLIGSFPYEMKTKLVHGQELTREEKNKLFNQLHTSSYGKYRIPLHGYMFDYSRWLKRYFVEFTYGDIEKFYALDKTSIRANLSNVKRIVEVSD